MALSPNAAAKIAALLQKLGSFNAALDLEENTKRRNATTALSLLDEGLPGAKRTVNQSLADRGLVQSGIGLGSYDTVNRNYLNAYNTTQQGLDTDLSDIARRRMTNQAQFDFDRATVEREDVFGQPLVAPPATPPAKTPVAKTAAKKVLKNSAKKKTPKTVQNPNDPNQPTPKVK